MANHGGNGEYPAEKAPNPFADDLPDTPFSNDPYASPHSSGYNPEVAGHYDSVVPHRGGVLLSLGIAGALLSGIGLVAILFCVPLNIFSLVFSVPAWMMAKHDLRGMAVGAIDPEGRGRTRTGYALGMLGVGLTMLSVVMVIGIFAGNAGTQAMFEFRSWLGW